MKSILLLILFISANAWTQEKYFGARSTEATLKFDASIEVKTDRSLTLNFLNGASSKASEIRNSVHTQLSFLIGHFQAASFLESFQYPGVLGDKTEFKYLSVAPKQGEFQRINYRFVGKSVFGTKVFSKSEFVSIPLKLPNNPATFYKKGVVNGVNKCTDRHYNSEDDLFYFWDPDQRGCPLRGNEIDVIRVMGQLQRLRNTTSTYPEYDRLFHTEELKISVFLGYIGDNPSASSTTKDEAYLTYKELIQKLGNQDFQIIDQKVFKKLNHTTSLEKTLRNQMGIKQKITITVLLSDSSVGARDKTFVAEFSKALNSSQLVAYDGHSGLGGNLDFDRFGIEKLNRFYQIYFFNGCSSYPYFNQSYFSQKPAGKKNLEIITAGLPTLTSTSTSNMLAFLNLFIQGKIHSYQTLMNGIEKSNGDESTYLMGVNGDEDNKFKPEGK